MSLYKTHQHHLLLDILDDHDAQDAQDDDWPGAGWPAYAAKKPSAKEVTLDALRKEAGEKRWATRGARFIVCVDLEALCWEDGKAPPAAETVRSNGSDIIEIGIAVLDTETMQVVEERSILTRPRTKLKVSAFCTELTSLTQEQVDEGEDLDIALATLAADFGDCAVASWGAYDTKHLARAMSGRSFLRGCTGQSRQHSFGDSHTNVRNLCAMLRGTGEGDLKETSEALGLGWEGHHHRGVDDARAVARILAKLLGGARGAL